jgi:hypothetical protein
MKYRHPLKRIVSQTRSHWDVDERVPAVRRMFERAMQCQTATLGAEVYAGEEKEFILYHTCKSRACPSCGYRATVQWLRERWAALPETIYKGITFTMPDVLWPIFRDNPRLAKVLSALAANIIQAQMSAGYGVRVGVIAILHTFNGRLEFNSHVHTMVTGGGLSSNSWKARVYYNQDQLMEVRREAVIRLLRTALKAGQLHSNIGVDEMEKLLTQQESRWWSIKIQVFKSKEHFLRYAGRHVRRPPIAQRRITSIGQETVTFWTKDKRKRGVVYVTLSLEDFVDRWAQHIPEHYQHAVRNFGLFAPRALSRTSALVFHLLGQKQRPRPKALSWAYSIKRDFGRDPLAEKTGKRMKWVRRLAPRLACQKHPKPPSG